jgi:hypothetical protein
MTNKQHIDNDRPHGRRSDDNEHVVHLGTRPVWQGEQVFSLSASDRRHHLHVIGKTGSGKMTLLRNLIIQDIAAGAGVGVIDPHGDLAEEILDYVPPWRTNDVVYFNPADQEYPVSFNLLAPAPPSERHRVASGIVGAFKSIWRDSWGPRMEYILYATIAALLECRNVSLLGVQRMLTDVDYRLWVVDQIDDVMLKTFWTVEFERYDRRMLSEMLSPIQNKIGQFLLAAPVRNIVGQVRNRIEPRYLMDHRKIFIANLSKGLLGEDKANLLGAALVCQFEVAAMGRADIPESERTDFFLSIDEFHNFSTDSFASLLSEARKYRLNLTLSHQYLRQLPDEIRDAVLGNVGSLVSFRVGNADAEQVAREFGNVYDGRYLGGLNNFEICAKLLQSGEQKEPFLGRTLPPLGRRYGGRAKIVWCSQKRHAEHRGRVEERIRRWLEA